MSVFACLSVGMSLCLSLCSSIYLSVCLFICLTVSSSLFTNVCLLLRMCARSIPLLYGDSEVFVSTLHSALFLVHFYRNANFSPLYPTSRLKQTHTWKPRPPRPTYHSSCFERLTQRLPEIRLFVSLVLSVYLLVFLMHTLSQEFVLCRLSSLTLSIWLCFCLCIYVL